jgi:hypothetical protein
MAAQQYKNVKIIEDSHDLLNQKIFIREIDAYTEPMSMGDIEEVESRLERNNTPYVLAQVETTLVDDAGEQRFKRGYMLFTQNAATK